MARSSKPSRKWGIENDEQTRILLNNGVFQGHPPWLPGTPPRKKGGPFFSGVISTESLSRKIIPYMWPAIFLAKTVAARGDRPLNSHYMKVQQNQGPAEQLPEN